MNVPFSEGGYSADDGSDIRRGALDDGYFYETPLGEHFARWNGNDGWHVLPPHQVAACAALGILPI